MPDLSQLEPKFAGRLQNFLDTLNKQHASQGITFQPISGYRSNEEQAALYNRLGPQHLAAPPGGSYHNYGGAVDLGVFRNGVRLGHDEAAPFLKNAADQSNAYQIYPGYYFNTPDHPHFQAGPPGQLANWRGGTDSSAMSAQSATPRGPDNRQIVFDALVKQAGLNPQQALGVLWSLGGESYSNLRTTAVNPNDPGGAIGIGQWTGGSGRRQQLEAYAASVGKPVTDINVQTAFLIHDITQGDYKNVLPLLKAAGSPADATRIWTTKYEVPHNAAAEAEARIAHGSRVGSLDAQGNFVPGSPAAPDSGGATPAPAAGGKGSSNTPAVPGGYAPMTPEERAGQSIGATLGSLANTMSGGGGGGAISAATGGPETDSSADHPAIRNELALNAQGPPTPSATPPSLLPGAPSPLGAQLGQLALQPSPVTSPVSADSITSGAPSMTAMLSQVGPVGTADTYNYLDPRATKAAPKTMGNLTGQRLF